MNASAGGRSCACLYIQSSNWTVSGAAADVVGNALNVPTGPVVGNEAVSARLSGSARTSIAVRPPSRSTP